MSMRLSLARPARATAALALLLVLVTMPERARAQDAKMYGPGERPDPAQVERILSAPAKPRARRNIKKVGVDSPALEPTRIALQVPFEFDSARLAPAALAQLDALAEGLRRLQGPVRLALDGHTDAKGSDAYNQALSLRRAAAVREHLVAREVPADWFQLRGLGRSQPLEGARPDAPENRRVELMRLP